MKHALYSAVLLALNIACIGGVAQAAEAEAPELKFPTKFDCYRVVPGIDVRPRDRSPKISQPIQIRAMVLGDKRAVLWLETSNPQPYAPKGTGYRLSELNFSAPKCAAHEVASANAASFDQGSDDALQIAGRSINAKAGFLSFDTLQPQRTIRARFSEDGATVGFVADDVQPENLPAERKVAAVPKDGRFQLLPLASDGSTPTESPGLRRSIFLRRNPTGKGQEFKDLEFTGEFELALGQYAVKAEAVIRLDELGLTAGTGKKGAAAPPLSALVGQWLSGEDLPRKNDKDPEPLLILNNGNVCAFWFKQADRILVVDLQRLQRELLTRLLADQQTALRGYDFKAKDFAAASRILGQLLLAEKISDSIRDELGDTETENLVTALTNARARLEELVFRLPVQVGADAWVVFFNPRTKKARLLPDAVQWRAAPADGAKDAPPGKGLQLKVPNRPLALLMTVEATPSFALDADQIPKLQTELADRYQSEDLRTVKVETGIPDAFTAALALDADSTRQLPSVRLQICKRDARNQLLIKLTAPESEASALHGLFFSKNGKGLPLNLSVDQFFVGRTNEQAGAVVKGLVKVPDFNIVEARDQDVPVTVWVDSAVSGAAKTDPMAIAFRYPGETATYTASIKKVPGSGLVILPVRTLNGELVLDVEYLSPITNKWILCTGGAEGLALVSE